MEIFQNYVFLKLNGQLDSTSSDEYKAQNATKQFFSFSFETVRVDEQGKVIETIPGEADYFTEDLDNGITLDMVRIPGGKFMRGAAEGEEGASDDEYP